MYASQNTFLILFKSLYYNTHTDRTITLLAATTLLIGLLTQRTSVKIRKICLNLLHRHTILRAEYLGHTNRKACRVSGEVLVEIGESLDYRR